MTDDVARGPAPIRLIDLDHDHAADPHARERFIRDLREGLLETGFVRVRGHSISDRLLADGQRLFERFFALDPVHKATCSGTAGGQRGYTPYGREHARDHASPDMKEFFHVGQSSPPEDADPRAYPANVWPAELPELRDAALGLYAALDACAERLLVGLAIGFGAPQRLFADMLPRGNSILRAVHYPPVTGDADPRALRAAPHEDINLITLLPAASDEGLEILTPANDWVAVRALPGEIVADAGDMLARMTNGRIPATTHRVIARGAAAKRSRYALPFFAHPRSECDLRVLDAFQSSERPARTPPITAGEFLQRRLREIGLA
jgi:isopenicillin N synthase-like dioxygenase